MGYGNKWQAHRFVSRTATLLGFSCSIVCIKKGPPPKGHPVNLTQLWEALEPRWASIPVDCFRHLVEFMLKQTAAVLRAKGGATQH